jgi:large subunit ribosomal protein L7/L12
LLGRDSGASSSNIELDEFEVVLTDAGQKKIPVIKVIRRITNLRLKEAKDLVDTAPSTLLRRVSRETAEHVQMELNVVGASIEIMKSTTDE